MPAPSAGIDPAGGWPADVLVPAELAPAFEALRRRSSGWLASRR